MLVFLSRLPATLERRVSVRQLIHCAYDGVTITLRGERGELVREERMIHAARIEHSLQELLAEDLRCRIGDSSVVYVLERPFIAIREYQPVQRSPQHRDAYERRIRADIECDLQVYDLPAETLARTAASHFFEARS